MVRFFLFFFLSSFAFNGAAQNYVFAQLAGNPVNTAGWNLQGAAYVGSDEMVLTNAIGNQSGAVFFNQPINLSQCNKWTVEYDFRLNGGTMADGIAFCFLDVPPVGFVNGGGLGIPATANGLKVCIDTYNNCNESSLTMPKLEIRWGPGYSECSSQPTLYNSNGNLSFLRSPSYNRAKIHYDNGLIQVFINNTLYLTGNQVFNFTGYFGFTASTGGLNDRHSIKNVIIYTEMPPSDAGDDKTICSGESVTIGSAVQLGYNYQWTPSAGLNNVTVSAPQLTLVNNTVSPVTYTYYVNTSFSNAPGCVSRDSVQVTVLPMPAVFINTNSPSACAGSTVSFTASSPNAGPNPVFQWLVNGSAVGTNSPHFSSTSLANGDEVSCMILSSFCGNQVSNTITMAVVTPVTPTVEIQSNKNQVCQSEDVVFTAVSNLPSASYQWKKNGLNVGSNNAIFTAANLSDGDAVYCVISTTSSCVTATTAQSNVISVPVDSPGPVQLGADKGFCSGSSVTLDAGFYDSYLWNTGSSASTIEVNTAGTYSVIAYTATGCAAYDTITILVFPSPVVDLGQPFSICDGSSVVLDPGSFSSYVWNDQSVSRTVSVNAPGLYSVKVTDANGCEGFGSTSVTGILPLPSQFLPADTVICSYGTIGIKPVRNFSSYLWSSGETTHAIQISQPGTYYLEVKDHHHCVGKDTIIVQPKQCIAGFWVPGAFTPNGDGRNDLFRPLLFGDVIYYRFSVFNRWGHLVYQTSETGSGWDGTIQGVKQGSGVFIWSCTYQFRNESRKVEKGQLILIR